MPPQAFISSYAPRLRTYPNALLTPVIPAATVVAPGSRTTKRGTVAVNYAEDGLDEDDIYEDGDSRRATGLRSRREDPAAALNRENGAGKIGKELSEPIEVQGIWRDWMGRLRSTR